MGPKTVEDKGIYRGVVQASAVPYLGHSGSYTPSSKPYYAACMVANYDGAMWANYVDGLRNRPGWSVARLSRETGLSTSTLWDYIGNKTGKAVTIPTVMAIAEAAGDDPIVAFRAAAGLAGESPEDIEISVVLGSDLDTDAKQELISDIVRRRERDRQARMEDTVEWIRHRGGNLSVIQGGKGKVA